MKVIFDFHFDTEGSKSLLHELFWLLRNGQFNTCLQWPELIFGVGRTWYDGPIWYIHLGIFSIDLSIK